MTKIKIMPDTSKKTEMPQCVKTSVSSCLFLVNSLRETDKYIQSIFMQGGCYQFHLFIKKTIPKCKTVNPQK